MNERTTEEMGRVRVPLARLPGLDPVGLYGRADQADVGVWSGLICDEGLAHDRWYVQYGGAQREVWTRQLALDLSDAATRDRVARWVAQRVGLQCGSTAPDWLIGWADYERTTQCWWLSGRNGSGTFLPERPDDTPPKVLWPRAVPALASLDPADPRLLADGSRFVDALALALVAQHVGGARE